MERAIKRVRSDLAAHGGGLAKESTLNGHSAEPSEAGSIHDRGDQDHEERKPHELNGDDAASTVTIPDTPASDKDQEGTEVDLSSDSLKDLGDPHTADTVASTDETPSSIPNDDDDGTTADTGNVPSPTTIAGPTHVIANQEEAAPPTPIATELPPSRMHRSKSADPHKVPRLPRTYTSSVPSQNGTESQTGDESSSSAAAKDGQRRRSTGRKKRSASTAGVPKEPKKSQRKVVIDDFEMMRVLGKGCAGKVLLVRHKQTSDLFALKAITKRHVLAHQELQHTLTEQAVLKRMAAESRDPFVVKLWWSFHDKENLFLVMVCLLFFLFSRSWCSNIV